MKWRFLVKLVNLWYLEGDIAAMGPVCNHEGRSPFNVKMKSFKYQTEFRYAHKMHTCLYRERIAICLLVCTVLYD